MSRINNDAEIESVRFSKFQALDRETFRALPPEERERYLLEVQYRSLPTKQREERRELRKRLGYDPKGRAPLADSVRRNHKVFIRFNDAELASVQAVADADGVSLAETARTLALEAAARRQNPET